MSTFYIFWMSSPMGRHVGFRSNQKKKAQKISTKWCDLHSPNNLNYDIDDSIGWKILPRASYKWLKSMYLVVHIACFRVNKKTELLLKIYFF